MILLKADGRLRVMMEEMYDKPEEIVSEITGVQLSSQVQGLLWVYSLPFVRFSSDELLPF